MQSEIVSKAQELSNLVAQSKSLKNEDLTALHGLLVEVLRRMDSKLQTLSETDWRDFGNRADANLKWYANPDYNDLKEALQENLS